MKKFQVVIILLLIFTWITQVACNGAGGNGKSLPVTLYAQQTTNWCWAASGEMIMKYLSNEDVSQCVEANDRFGYTDCCQTPTPSKCVKGGWPQFALHNFTYNSTEMGHALSWDELVAQIDSNKPVGFSWEWTGGGGHYMVAKGYTTSGNNNMVAVNDPWPWDTDKFRGGTSKIISYSEYISSSTHSHLKDDYNITEISTE